MFDGCGMILNFVVWGILGVAALFLLPPPTNFLLAALFAIAMIVGCIYYEIRRQNR